MAREYVDVVAHFSVESLGRVRMEIEDSSLPDRLAWVMPASVADEWAKKLGATAKEAWDLKTEENESG